MLGGTDWNEMEPFEARTDGYIQNHAGEPG